MSEKSLDDQLGALFSDAVVPEAELASEEPQPQESLAEPSEVKGVAKAPTSEEVAAAELPPRAELQTRQEGIARGKDLQAWRERLVIAVLRIGSALGLLALIGSLSSAVLYQRAAVYITAYSILLAITLPRRLPYLVRAVALPLLVYGLGLVELLDVGLMGDGPFLLFAVPILATILLDWKAGAVGLGLSAVTLAAVAWTISKGFLVLPYSIEEMAGYYAAPIDWITSIVVFIMLAVVILIAVSRLLRGEVFASQFAQQNQALQEAQIALQEAHYRQEAINEQLRQTVAQSTRRADQLHAAAEVSRVASSVLEPEALIRQTVNLIRDRFDYYYVGLFLVDATGRWVVLRAGTGRAGREMLARGHKLEVGSDSMIGWCTARGQARISLDVGEEAIRFDNPLLPETRSEMALPLISRSQIIGALTVQSAAPQAFSNEDIAVLQTMADQVANAVESARLLQEMEHLARHNQSVSELSGKLRGALDLEGVLQTTVRELGLALGASEAVIRLGALAPSAQSGGDGRGGGGDDVLSPRRPGPIEASKGVRS